MYNALILMLLCSTTAAHAVTTRTWRLTNYKDFEDGEATGVLISSLGEVSSGYGASRVEVGESVVYSSLTAPDGTVYLGTGDEGRVYSYKSGKLKKLVKLDAVLVTTLALGPSGTVFAGVMPGGRVFSIDREGRAKELAKLDAEHVWALSWDEGKQTLFAATGPTGKLFAIDTKSGNRARLYYDTGEKHLLSLLRGDDGTLYAGSADQAILYKITPDGSGGKLSALHDFEGDEIRAIARRGSTLYVAVNEFQKSTTTITPTPAAARGTKIVLPTGPAAGAPPASVPGRDRKGKGAIYRVEPDGRVEQLHALADGYFTAVHVDNDGNVYAASGANGRVYLIRNDRTVLTAFDLPERQVLTLAFDGPEKVLGTGDAGAIYKITNDPPKDANYLTKVLDAQFTSRWGNLRWTGQGALAFSTRSGNTSKPDKSWSSWQVPSKVEKVASGAGGHIGSPEARYLQVRVGFSGSKTALRDLSVYYKPQNQRQRLTEILLGDETVTKRPTAVARTKPRSPIIKIKWKTENPDEDELAYRLFFREENETNWKPLGGPEPLARSEYEWNTESIPDGNYLLKVVASDERSNPKEEALESSLISSPFLVDNRKPEFADLKVTYPLAQGRARDSFSPISELAYSLDGGDWQPFSPKDSIFDDSVEDFAVKLPSGLSSGAHSLAVRAVDAADNVGAIQTTFRVR